MWVRWPRWPSSSFIVSSVVVQLPGRPRLLAWMWTGCGRPSSSTARATAAMICRGVTPKWSTAASRSLTLPACRFFQTSTPPGLTSFARVRPSPRDSSQAMNAFSRLGLAPLDRPHDVMVVAHQDEEALVDAGRVGELLVRVPGGERGDGGVEGRGVAEAGVLVAGGERAGHAPRRCRCACSRVRRTGSAWRLCSGHIFRAVLTFGPAMWQCMSTPPGMTTRPAASIARVGFELRVREGGRRSCRRRSRCRGPRRRSRWPGRRRSRRRS